jgi:hypothetical protein
MDTSSNKYYALGHETLRNAEPAGSTPASCDCSVEVRKTVSNCRRNVGLFFELSGTVVSNLSQRRLEEVASAADPGTSAQLVRIAKGASETYSLERSDRGRVLHRSLDFEADCQSDRKELWGDLPSGPCLVRDGRRLEVELAKTRTPRLRAQRRGHRALEENHLAPYKKKPKSVTPIWPFSTKVASCWSRTSLRPGHQWARPRCFGTAIGATKSRPSPVLPPLPSANAWGFSLSSIPPTSGVKRYASSCAISCAICEETWNSSGMEGRFTRKPSSKNSWRARTDSMFTGSRDTHPSLIRTNSYGPKPSAIFPTAVITISKSLEQLCADRWVASRDPSACYGPASKPPSCHGDNCVRIHYLAECQ